MHKGRRVWVLPPFLESFSVEKISLQILNRKKLHTNHGKVWRRNLRVSMFQPMMTTVTTAPKTTQTWHPFWLTPKWFLYCLSFNRLFFFKLIFWRNFGNWAVTTAQPFSLRLWLLSDTYVCESPFLASHADRIAPVFVAHIFGASTPNWYQSLFIICVALTSDELHGWIGNPLPIIATTYRHTDRVIELQPFMWERIG